MSDTPFIKFFPGDFLAGTSGLSPAERGVYITILCLIWDGDGPVSMDEGRLARRCGMPKASFKKALQALIDEGKLTRTADGLMNGRAKKTLVDRQNRTRNATHAANQRWGSQEQKNKQKQGEETAEALPEQCVADAKPEARSQIYGGGGSACAREDDFDQNDPPAENGDQTPREQVLEAMGLGPDGVAGPSRFLGGQGDVAELGRWLELPGLTLEAVCEEVRRVAAAKSDGPPSTFRYFRPAMQRLSAALSAPRLEPVATQAPSARASPVHLWKLDPEKFNDDGSIRE